MFIHKDKLMRQKFVRGSMHVKLLSDSIGSIFVVLACHLASKKQFSDDVVCSRLSIEFASYVRCWEGGKSWLHPKGEEEGRTFN